MPDPCLSFTIDNSISTLQVAVPVVTPAQCATSMGTREDGQLCAGGVAGKDSCQVSLQI